MSFAENVRIDILSRDGFTCQHKECNHSFYPTGTYMNTAGFYVENGDWNVNAAHTAPRDYIGRDRRAYNPDGSLRGITLDVLHHAEQEVRVTNVRNALMLLLGQTIRTFDWIERNKWTDQDVPHETGRKLKLGRLELIEFNNQRREKLKAILIKRFGAVVLNGTKADIDSRQMLGAGTRRRV